MNLNDQIDDTLAALERGETPNCPGCDAPFDYTERKHSHRWTCDAVVWMPEMNFVRYDRCYERQLAAKDAEIAALKEHDRQSLQDYTKLMRELADRSQECVVAEAEVAILREALELIRNEAMCHSSAYALSICQRAEDALGREE